MKLYIYDHCPYCVRARMPFGIKDIPYELVTLLNDDVDAPTSMIGTKMVPILEKDDGSWMAESLDIVRYIDTNYGDAPALAESANRADIQQWMGATKAAFYRLMMPRWVVAPLNEFATPDAVAYFTEKKEASIGSFTAHLVNSHALKQKAEEWLRELAPMIHSPSGVNGPVSYDDIELFGYLRGITIVQGLDIPPAVRDYLDTMSNDTGVPLYDDIAIA